MWWFTIGNHYYIQLLATGKTEKNLWDRVRRSVGFAFGESSDQVDTMRRILSLSYFQLPYRLRSCLLYLATFPEDYEIERTRVVHRWIAEGFIHGEDGQDLIQLGDKCFHKLINSSLVQPLRIGYDGKAEACRVHDTILDFLVHKSTEDNFCTLLSSHSKLPHSQDIKVRRLSVMANDCHGDVNLSPKLNTSHLRSLGVFMYHKQLLSCIVDFSSLHLLDLQGCGELLQNHHLKNIGRLSQLRYLNVAGTCITELPSEIGNLQFLEILNAEHTGVEVLPEAVTRLKRLVCLLMTEHYTKLPDGIGNLKNLLELNDVDILKYSLNFVEELGELTNLRYLGIRWNADCLKGDKACYKEKQMSSLCKLNKLQKMKLCIYDRVGAHAFVPTLNSIHIVYIDIPNICNVSGKWLKSLVNLQSLSIAVSVVMEQEEFQFIGSIPSLLDCELEIMVDRFRTGPIIFGRGFQRLQKFTFVCHCSGAFVVQEGAMPMLTDLVLHIDPIGFKSTVGGVDFGIQHLSCLGSVGLSFHSSRDLEGDFKKLVETHPNRPTLTFYPGDPRDIADYFKKEM